MNMDQILFLHSALTGCFLFLLIYCMYWDIRERIIPNRAAAGMAGIALVFLFSQFDLFTLAGAAAVLLLFIPWRKGMLGAGDVKLLFCSALYLGTLCFCVSLVLSGIGAFIYMITRKKRATDSVAMGAFYAPAAAAILIIKELV